MATETGAAAIAAENASGGIGAVSSAGAAIKGFVLSNPISLAAVAGLVVGVLGYHFLFDHGENLVGNDEQKDANAAEPSTS